jgi:cytochrome P450
MHFETKYSISYIPENTSVLMPFYTLHRDPRNFSPHPDEFIPERWLPIEKQIELEPTIFNDQTKVHLNHNAFIPFSVGPSNCVGKNLAWLEMRMLVCLVMQKLEMRFEEGYRPSQWDDDMQDYFVMMKGRLPVVLTARK